MKHDQMTSCIMDVVEPDARPSQRQGGRGL